MERDSIVARDFLGLRNSNPEPKTGRDLGMLKEGELNCPTSGLHLFPGSIPKDCMFGPQVQTESDIQHREELKRHIKDKVCLANMALQQPYSNKTAALQQFMAFKNLPEERLQKGLFNQLATSGVQPISTADAFDLNNRSATGSQEKSTCFHQIVKGLNLMRDIPSLLGDPVMQGFFHDKPQEAMVSASVEKNLAGYDFLKSFSLDPKARNAMESGDYCAQQNSAACRHFGVTRVAYPSQVLDDQGSSAHHMHLLNHSLSISNLSSPPLFKGQQASTTSSAAPMVKPFVGMHFAGQHSFSPVVSASAGTTAPRAAPNVPGKPVSAQLTIFYAGTVNVYDDVPADKAEAIMFLAGSGSSWSGKISSPPTQGPTMSIPVASGGHSRAATPVCPSLSNSLPSMNPQVNTQKSQASSQTSQSTTVSSSAGEFQTGQNIGNPSNQLEGPKSTTARPTATPIAPSEVPQARKASLTRFLEKRKERVCSKVPYPTKKSPEDSSNREVSLSPKHCYTTLHMDGCESQQHEPMGDGLDGNFVPKPENLTSCLDGDQPWSLKVEKNDNRERKLQLT